MGYSPYILQSLVEERSMTIATVKDEARRLVDGLPDDATWEGLQYQIYFRQAVEAGLKDSREGRVVPLEEALR
jgi:predicted transcriptional regulator